MKIPEEKSKTQKQPEPVAPITSRMTEEEIESYSPKKAEELQKWTKRSTVFYIVFGVCLLLFILCAVLFSVFSVEFGIATAFCVLFLCCTVLFGILGTRSLNELHQATRDFSAGEPKEEKDVWL